MNTEKNSNQGLTHSGGVVSRHNKANEKEYLLVESNHTKDAWVIPKGHIEKGESIEQTAIREVLEESGIHAKIINKSKLDSVAYTNGRGKLIAIQFFEMEYENEADEDERKTNPSIESRRIKWVALNKAIKLVRRDETKSVFKQVKSLM